jgi:hypothetical protein
MRGGPIAYSEAELAFIEARRDRPRAEIRLAFVESFGRDDVSTAHITALCKRNGWTTARAWFSPADDAVLRESFADRPTAQVAALLGRSATAVSHRAHKLGLTKSAAYLATAAAGRMQRGDARGAATRYQKGQTPQNKGKKYPKGWAPGRMSGTQFVKGQDGWNHKPVGYERVVADYTFTKVSDVRNVSWTVNWKLTHVLKWEALHGPVPDGQCLKSRDGNRMNTDPANWQLIPRAILPRLNGGRGKRLGYDQAPAELKPLLLTTAKLAHAVKQRRPKVAA